MEFLLVKMCLPQSLWTHSCIIINNVKVWNVTKTTNSSNVLVLPNSKWQHGYLTHLTLSQSRHCHCERVVGMQLWRPGESVGMGPGLLFAWDLTERWLTQAGATTSMLSAQPPVIAHISCPECMQSLLQSKCLESRIPVQVGRICIAVQMGGIWIPIQSGGICIPVHLGSICYSNPSGWNSYSKPSGVFTFQSMWAEFKYSHLCLEYCIPEFQVNGAGISISTSQSVVSASIATDGFWHEAGLGATQCAPCSLHGVTLCCLCLVLVSVFICLCATGPWWKCSLFYFGRYLHMPKCLRFVKGKLGAKEVIWTVTNWALYLFPLMPLGNDSGLNKESLHRTAQRDENSCFFE